MTAAPVGHHCPTCIDEARAEYRKGPGRQLLVADAKAVSFTNLLLLAIGAMYLVEIVAGGTGALFDGPKVDVLVRLGASVGLFPEGTGLVGITMGQYWRLATATFLHAGIIHLALNAYVLYLFGSLVERELGRFRFLAIYAVAGICASATSYALASDPFVVGVGASGAIFGVVGAFVAYNYRNRHMALAAARLRSLLPFLIINAVIGFTIPFVDWRAHLGGFVAGIIAGVVAGSAESGSSRIVAVLGFAALLVAAAALVAYGNSRFEPIVDLINGVPG
jgi:membrane associated rhomboid family serine protease